MKTPLKILHLEDNILDAELVLHLLKKEQIPCDISRVVDEQHFVSLLDQGGIDLILADYSLPNFDGITALEIARKKSPLTPFIFVTGAMGEERAIETLKSGAIDYVLKDNLTRLPAAILRAMDEAEKRIALQKAEGFIRQQAHLLDLANDAILIRDLNDKIIYWNQGAERLYGWTKEEALGCSVHELLKTKFPQSLEKVREEAFRQGSWSGELIHTQKNGECITIDSRWTIQRDFEQQVFTTLEINHDISDRKRAEEELRRAHNELEQRVQERTAELFKANQDLQIQIAERHRVEQELLEISGRVQIRIGQDLHDGLSQQLTGIALMSRVLKEKLAKKSLPEASEVDQIEKLITGAIRQARDLARGLYPVELEENGLTSGLEDLAAITENIFHVKCYVEVDPSIVIDDHNMATHLYRIAQECIHNAIKHGGAKEVTVRLIRTNGSALLEIKDNGSGPTQAATPSKTKKRGMGLRIMNYRANMIGATFNIQKAPEGGTLATCIFRLPRRRANRNKSKLLTSAR